MGQLAERRSDLVRAEACYREAVRLHPTSHYKAHNNLAQLLHRRSTSSGPSGAALLDEAEGHYRQAVRAAHAFTSCLAFFSLLSLLSSLSLSRARTNTHGPGCICVVFLCGVCVCVCV
mmetsp:Transcript_14750/g.34747  ORF Transcript_14750/g.34747 Transcript_14750/m.34747 type:complete len:118 (+) Transcript_14750:218-571(+)